MHLKKYIEEHGIIKKWFAVQIGVQPAYLGEILTGRRPLAVKYWSEINLLTRGKVRFEDLVKMNETYEEKCGKEKSERRKKIRESCKIENNSQLSKGQGKKQK
jgi:DNA-binding transcriptional regulator YdaS (Cro superfamily)